MLRFRKKGRGPVEEEEVKEGRKEGRKEGNRRISYHSNHCVLYIGLVQQIRLNIVGCGHLEVAVYGF